MDHSEAVEARRYNPQDIEGRWQQRWLDDGLYEVDNDDPRETRFVLSMYPYPSGPAHIGHVRNYTFGDLLVRYNTMQGRAVLSPMGYDSFGLPAENAAIKHGEHPRPFTDARVEELGSSLRRLGAVYDHRRTIKSHDPEYMRWNQIFFQKFYEAGLIYRTKAPGQLVPGLSKPCWPMSRWSTAAVNGPTTWSRNATWNSGSAASPTTPRNCWMIWTIWSGPNG